MRKLLQKVVPYPVKLQIKLMQRKFHEWKKRYTYPSKYLNEDLGNCQFELIQPIKQGLFFENKIHNLKLVRTKINNLVVKPNEVFSFWKLVGKPTEKNQFKKGRNLINGKLSDDFGGGICQFSSILYHLALQTGFEIIERHSHSLDIYEENERFTPLGADSTVVFGYKDLQFKNIGNASLQFQSSITNSEISLKIFAEKKISLKNVEFDHTVLKNGVEVNTLVDNHLLFKNFYRRS